jgi:hypothetical protein
LMKRYNKLVDRVDRYLMCLSVVELEVIKSKEKLRHG